MEYRCYCVCPGPEVAHVLVAGTTALGKTVLLRTLLLSLALLNPQRNLQMALIDPGKVAAYQPVAELPHLLRPVITDADVAVNLLQGMVTEMERRDKEKRSTPALIIAIDELADLRMAGGKAVEDNLTRLTQRGRESRHPCRCCYATTGGHCCW